MVINNIIGHQVKWNFKGEWSYVDHKIELLYKNKNGNDELFMNIVNGKIIPSNTIKPTKNRYFSQYANNGEWFVTAKHKYIGA